MNTARKILETEALCEHLAKKHTSSLLRFKALFYISEYENLSVSMIIDKLGIKKSNFALLSKELIDEGLCFASSTSTDKRCKCLKLTEKGKAELDNYLSKLQKEFDFLNINLNEFNDYLDKIIKFLNRTV